MGNPICCAKFFFPRPCGNTITNHLMKWPQHSKVTIHCLPRIPASPASHCVSFARSTQRLSATSVCATAEFQKCLDCRHLGQRSRNPPHYAHTAPPYTLLIAIAFSTFAGCGGGYDFFAGIPLFFALKVCSCLFCELRHTHTPHIWYTQHTEMWSKCLPWQSHLQ